MAAPAQQPCSQVMFGRLGIILFKLGRLVFLDVRLHRVPCLAAAFGFNALLKFRAGFAGRSVRCSHRCLKRRGCF